MRMLFLCLVLLAHAPARPAAPLSFDPRYEAAFDREDFAEAERIALRHFEALPRPPDLRNAQQVTAVRMLSDFRTWQARFAEAESLLAPVAAALKAHVAADAQLRASVYARLAQIYVPTYRFAEADEQFRLSLGALGAKPSEQEEAILERLVDSYSLQGRHWEALKSAERLLAVRESLHGPRHPSVGVALVTIGTLYQTPYRSQQQARTFAHARAILEPAFKALAPTPAEAYENMIYWADSAYAHRDDWKGNLCALRRQLVVEVEKRRGKTSVFLVAPLRNYAAYCEEELGHSAKESLYKRSLDIALRTHGARHPVTIKAQRDFATFYASRERGNLERFAALAQQLTSEALAGTRAVYGSDSPGMAHTLLYDFVLEGAHGCRFRDRSCERRVLGPLESFRKALGPGHPYVAILTGEAAERLGGYSTSADSDADVKARNELVDRLYRDALAILRAFYGPGHPQLAFHAAQYGNWLRSNEQKPGLAVELFAETLASYRRHFGDADGATQTAWEQYFYMLLRQKRYKDANAQIGLALAALEPDSAANYRRIADLLGAQASTLASLEQGDAALRALERRADLFRRYGEAYQWGEALQQLTRSYAERKMADQARETERLASCLKRVRIGEKHDCK